MSERRHEKLFDPARGALRDLWRSLKNAGYVSPLYGYTLGGRRLDRLRLTPRDPQPGSVDIGNALFRGRYDFAGQTLTAPNGIPWALEGASEPWLEAIHGFDWLRHFQACEGDSAKRQVQALVRSWIERYSDWHPLAWRPHVLASRIVAWMRHDRLTIASADPAHRDAVLNSIARQARHLARAWPTADGALPRLIAVVGLAYGGLCLPDGTRRLARALKLVRETLAVQILPDGGYITRNPSEHLAALQILIALRDTLLGADHEFALEIQNRIDRMAPTLRFFRHGDGGLALFNGGFEESSTLVSLALEHARARGKAPHHSPQSGFHGLAAGRTRIIVDTGTPPPADFSGRAHAGALSFEMSIGKERLIVNCGSVGPAQAGPAWDRVVRSSAAHSTLVIDNRNSCAIMGNGRIGARPSSVAGSREETDGSVWVEARHDGYQRTYGLVHRRRLYLDPSGKDVRGEDIVNGPGAERNGGLSFDVRFHLHPTVNSSIVQNGESVLLRLPRGGGWRFHARGGAISVEESIYLGQQGASRRCEQIVVSSRLSGTETAINWSIKQL
ncbi:MAG: heparinase II/III family protein [Sphingomonadales bacterium]